MLTFCLIDAPDDDERFLVDLLFGAIVLRRCTAERQMRKGV